MYRLDGKRVPSVTTIVGATQAKPHLVAWAARMAAEYAVDHWADLGNLEPGDRITRIKGAADRARDAAALSGTQVHAMAETLLSGEPVDVPPEQVGKVEAFAAWWANAGFRAVHTEVRVHGNGFAGTFDCAAVDEWGHLWLLDWKTGKSVYPEMAVQLAGYASAVAWVLFGLIFLFTLVQFRRERGNAMGT